MNRRTVAVVAPYYPPRLGGVERYAERIAYELRDSSDMRPLVITTSVSRRREVEIRDGIDVVRLPRWFTVSNTPINPTWFWSVSRLLRAHDVQVVNTHAPVPFLPDVAVVVSGRRPVIQSYHAGSMVKHVGRLDNVIRFYEKHVLSRILSRADAVIAASPSSLACRVAKFRVITPGVDTEIFTPSSCTWGSTFLYVGRLDRSSAWKGVDVLLEAFAILQRSAPDVRLRVVGSGDALLGHKSTAQALGIADRVEFAGQLTGDALVRAYHEARALILPSLTESESFGMTLVEAMSCSRPVVGSAVGGIPLVIEDGSNGLLVPPGNAHALAKACRRLFDDDNLCLKLGVEGRRRAETTYAWPQLVGKYLDLFRELMP